MNKNALVKRVATRNGVSKAVAKKAVDAFTNAIVVDVRRKGTIELAGLGKVAIKSSKATKGRLEAKRRARAKEQMITLTPSKLLEWHVGSILASDKSRTTLKAKSASARI